MAIDPSFSNVSAPNFRIINCLPHINLDGGASKMDGGASKMDGDASKCQQHPSWKEVHPKWVEVHLNVSSI